MCGIAGAIGRITPAVIDAVARMNAAQVHRGPDDEGCWKSVDGSSGHGVILAFRRLAIIDLTPDGHQPMVDPQTGNVIVFNGEIYNYRELRDELRKEGVAFSSQSDTEVLLQAYGRWGLDAVHRLRGMFAFAIWDATKKQTILARDRIGIKPLYVCTLDQPGDQSVMLFASEVRSLLGSGMVRRRLNTMALATYAWNGFVIGPETIVEGIRLLPAGTVGIVSADNGTCELHRYWRIPDAGNDPNAVERLEEELSLAVSQHLVSDVPLGVFLSGGIDSSAVTAMAVRSVGSSVRTFNISFDEAQFDESRHAKAVAAALGTQHTEVRLSQAVFRAQLQDALRSIDQPTFDGINTYFVSRAVREAGITVALAGTGGDELFGGYKSFVDIPKASKLARRLAQVPLPMLRSIAGWVARLKLGRFGEIPPQTRWGKLGDVLATRGGLIELYQTSYSLFTTDFLGSLLRDPIHAEVRSGLPRFRVNELAELTAGNPLLHAISKLELSCFIGERLLRDTDAASMAVSLEARVPLLDHRVIEAAAAVHEQRRFEPLGSKRLLRDLALSGLDTAMFERPKAGFVLPIDIWCREQLNEELTSVFLDADLCESVGLNQEAIARLWRVFQAGAPGIYWSRVWSVFVLLWWCRTYGVSV